jgi:hypothetical protein
MHLARYVSGDSFDHEIAGKHDTIKAQFQTLYTID